MICFEPESPLTRCNWQFVIKTGNINNKKFGYMLVMKKIDMDPYWLFRLDPDPETDPY